MSLTNSLTLSLDGGGSGDSGSNGVYLNGELLTNNPTAPYSNPINLGSTSMLTQVGAGSYELTGNLTTNGHELVVSVGDANTIKMSGKIDGGSLTPISGVADLSDQPVNATGGATSDITVNGTDYRVHTFTSNGTYNSSYFFTLNSGAGTVLDAEQDYLIVGGGGQGGTGHGGGGGGAGEVNQSTASITSGSHIVTVGTGGQGGTGNPYSEAGNGSASAFGTITAQGGGRGGSSHSSGAHGTGAGGGGSQIAGNIQAPGTNPNGFTGGESSNRNQIYQPLGGGGAGAGGDGGDATFGTSGDAGDGGVGITTNITGISMNIAGGGGGGTRNDWASSQAGTATHGGGNGGRGAAGGDGQANTGAGGGGGSRRNNGIVYKGGDGGDGIVVIRHRR